jgi:hypothetical protein
MALASKAAARREYNRQWMKADRAAHHAERLASERRSKKLAKERMGEAAWKERALRYNLHHQYRITLEKYKEMLEAQLGGCAICGCSPPKGKRLHVDHDHVTEEVRGLLCHKCNQGMIAVDANPEWCVRAQSYWLRYQRRA